MFMGEDGKIISTLYVGCDKYWYLAQIGVVGGYAFCIFTIVLLHTSEGLLVLHDLEELKFHSLHLISSSRLNFCHPSN